MGAILEKPVAKHHVRCCAQTPIWR